MKNVMAFVFAGVRTGGLSVLTRSRSAAAVPFAGKYRLIDFTLSNCVNSELYQVAVLAQNSPHSLIKHVGRGEPWDLNRRDMGVQILQPYERQEGRRWYEGTADALRQNLDVLRNSGARHVFVLSSELAYKMDYSWMLRFHQERGARCTLGVGIPDSGDYSRFGTMRVDDQGRIRDYARQPDDVRDRLAFLGVYLFETDFLREILLGTDRPNLFLDCIRPQLDGGDAVRAYRYDGGWREIVTVGDYLRSHRRLLDEPPVLDLHDPGWRIFTRSEEMPPVWIDPGAEVHDSLVANGAVVEGRVERSVLSPGVYVGPNAVVRGSVLLNGARVEEGATVEYAVLDKDAHVLPDAVVGGDDAGTPEQDPPELEGSVVVGKGVRIERGARVPRGSVVEPVLPTVEEAIHTMVEGIFR